METRQEECDPLELANKRPEWSAKAPLTSSQKYAALGLIVAIAVCFALAPLATGRFLIGAITLFYLVSIIYRVVLVWASVRPDSSFSFSKEEMSAPRDWPMYSILVPMYHEPETLSQMISSLSKLDYPKDKLDIQLLLEADDDITLNAAKAIRLPPFMRITPIPPSFPRTKPKACNIGLHEAKGEFLVIYDAEDRPESDQLKKAVLAFDACPANVACVQSRLNYYNPRHNLLTRHFAADYSTWFDLSLPGLAYFRTVIPLGGTSNHFRTSILRELLGWDAYNVTEDCDLGVRLARAGYETRMLDTTTWEEACSSLPYWIRQRTRWQKGYIQTFFVHTRDFPRLVRELGPKNTFHFLFLVGGSVFSTLANPFFWAMTLAWFLFRPAGLDRLYPGPLFAASAFCLFAGNFIFFYVSLLGCYRRRYDGILWANLLLPIYWAMMSVSGWRAFIQFCSNPHHWEKTKHGLS